MKSLLLFLVLVFTADQATIAFDNTPQKPDYLNAVTIDEGASALPDLPQKNFADHPVLKGETATDAGGHGAEHLGPLIFMVMAFLIAFIAGCLWWNQHINQGRRSVEDSTLFTMVLASAIFSLVAAIWLLNVGHLHHLSQEFKFPDVLFHHHHLAEVLFCFLAFITLVFICVVLKGRTESENSTPALKWIFAISIGCSLALMVMFFLYTIEIGFRHPHNLADIFLIILCALLMIAIVVLLILLFFGRPVSKSGIQRAIFFGSYLELLVIIILLTPNDFYKLCADSCVMHGAQEGVTFDQPCSDNIAFMTLHHTMDVNVSDYKADYVNTPLPLFLEYASPIAMHDPIYPEVIDVAPGQICSKPVTFSLDDEKGLISSCTLFVKKVQFDPAVFTSAEARFEPINETDDWSAVWTREGNMFNKTLFPGGGTSVPFDHIFHNITFPGQSEKITYITYKFVIQFQAYENPDGLMVATPDESIEISFVLQDFHKQLPMFPAPVYAQGNIADVLDVLFIPAGRKGMNDVMDAEFYDDFRKSCRSIIKDAIFQEPSLRFWRKQFNFWINHQAGQAVDARCTNCCHEAPANYFDESTANRISDGHKYFSEDIDFKALLHKGPLWDLTDHCNTFFSAEMDLVDDNNERSSFLHELGHAAYGLSDEYYGGFNDQAVDHLPNNWFRRGSAKRAAPYHRKTEHDVAKIF